MTKTAGSIAGTALTDDLGAAHAVHNVQHAGLYVEDPSSGTGRQGVAAQVQTKGHVVGDLQLVKCISS